MYVLHSIRFCSWMKCIISGVQISIAIVHVSTGRRPFNPQHLENATIELRKVPPNLNNISSINEHFSKFGHITNIQVQLVENSINFSDTVCQVQSLGHISNIQVHSVEHISTCQVSYELIVFIQEWCYICVILTSVVLYLCESIMKDVFVWFQHNWCCICASQSWRMFYLSLTNMIAVFVI